MTDLQREKELVLAYMGNFVTPRDGGLDDERGKAAAAEVQRWRDDDTLPFPDYTPTQKEEMADRLDYPPEGSKAAQEAKLEKPD